MHSSVNVETIVAESFAREPEVEQRSIPAYEEVDLEPCAGRAIIGGTIGDDMSCDKYSELVKSDMTPPRPHNYETISLSEIGDYVNVSNA